MTTSQEETDFSHYGTQFQESLVTLILDDRVFADQINEVLDVNFLELKYLQAFIRQLFEYRHKYGTHPSRSTFSTVLKAGLGSENELVRNQTLDFFNSLPADATEGSEHTKETALDFCKKQKLKGAMMRCVGLIKTSSFDEISKVMNDALLLGADNNHGYDYVVDFEKRFTLKARNPVTTGWTKIDAICNGGLGAGELGVVVAPTGAGKSMALVHLGAQAVLAGKTVIHYTLELQDTVVALRYDSCITGVPLTGIFNHKSAIFEKVQEVPGRLIIKEYPTKTASTEVIKAHLERLKRQHVDIGMVIVDYGDLLRPVSAQREKRNELESIYEQLRAIAQIFNCPVWTASQTNRSGLNAEVITMESISEAFNKCFVADFIFTISRTIEDKNNNEGRIFVAKNRNGPDGMVFPIFMDTRSVQIKVLSQSTQSVGELVAKSTKQQAESLREKYKNFKQEKKEN
jgi:hypothetical protein